MTHQFEKISVIGTGVMGTQIAITIARYGYEVKAYDTDLQSFGRTLGRIRGIIGSFGKMAALPAEEWEKGAEKVEQSHDLNEAIRGTDLIIEALPENLELKRKMFSQLDSLVPQKTILGTNSTSIPISQIESATQRADRCLNLHFYQLVAGFNMVDLMGGTKTAPEVLEKCRQWVRSIGCIPLMIKKELLGFGFPTVLRAVRREALHMWAGDYLDFRDLDRAWMTFTKMPMGPFGIIDALGLDVAYEVEMVYYRQSQDPRDSPPQALKEKIERKELGMKTGKGFYTYPNPEYGRPDFLKG